jgi:serine/threonine protein kinase
MAGTQLLEWARAHSPKSVRLLMTGDAELENAIEAINHEVGEVRGQPFFSLESCDGGTRTEQLRKQRPAPREAAALVETLARAMHYAHLRGVVHRDLKPGNVLLTGAERVAKITDFGLAKRTDAEAREVSQSGAILGTASYMAPEQAAGKVRDTGPAADAYALGALLYECLTGRPPFEGPQHEVLLSVLSEEPVPPSRRDVKVPADLETICLKVRRGASGDSGSGPQGTGGHDAACRPEPVRRGMAVARDGRREQAPRAGERRGPLAASRGTARQGRGRDGGGGGGHVPRPFAAAFAFTGTRRCPGRPGPARSWGVLDPLGGARRQGFASRRCRPPAASRPVATVGPI